jgi:hypothetical protein
MTPIEVLAHFDNDGIPSPLRFRIADKEIKIEQVLSVTEEKLAGNKMLCFRCQIEINGEPKPLLMIPPSVGAGKTSLLSKM